MASIAARRNVSRLDSDPSTPTTTRSSLPRRQPRGAGGGTPVLRRVVPAERQRSPRNVGAVCDGPGGADDEVRERRVRGGRPRRPGHDGPPGEAQRAERRDARRPRRGVRGGRARPGRARRRAGRQRAVVLCRVRPRRQPVRDAARRRLGPRQHRRHAAHDRGRLPADLELPEADDRPGPRPRAGRRLLPAAAVRHLRRRHRRPARPPGRQDGWAEQHAVVAGRAAVEGRPLPAADRPHRRRHDGGVDRARQPGRRRRRASTRRSTRSPPRWPRCRRRRSS